jgi:hypothetical protein
MTDTVDGDDKVTGAPAKADPDVTDTDGAGAEKLAKPSLRTKPSFATYGWVASGFVLLGSIGLLWWYGPETVATHKESLAPVMVPVPGREALSAARAEQTRRSEQSRQILDQQGRIAANASADNTSADNTSADIRSGDTADRMNNMASAGSVEAITTASWAAVTTASSSSSSTDDARIAMQLNEAPQELAAAPADGLVEATSEGRLPTKGRYGELPWMVYARPFATADPRPRVAVLIAHLGQSKRMVDLALQALPPGISLSFMAYSTNLGGMIQSARTKGHEVLLSVPLEPAGFPRVDSGP